MDHLILRPHVEQQADRPNKWERPVIDNFFQIEQGLLNSLN